GLQRCPPLRVRDAAQRRGALLCLELHAFHAAHGRWPKSLDELKCADLVTTRIDPFSEHDFVYKLKDGKPMLYSVAADGKDDGGRHDPSWESREGGDYVFWPVPQSMR